SKSKREHKKKEKTETKESEPTTSENKDALVIADEPIAVVEKDKTELPLEVVDITKEKKHKKKHKKDKTKELKEPVKEEEKPKERVISEEKRKILDAFHSDPTRFLEENREYYTRQAILSLREMFAEEAMEGGVDPATLDLDTMAIGAARQLAITGRLDEMLIAMILGEAEADVDGNEDNEYSDQANEQEDPLESILNDPNLPPWAKEEAFVEQVYMQQQQMQQQKFESEYGEKSRHSTRASSRGGRGGGRGGHFASSHFGRRKHYRFPPRGKITRFPVTPFQADLTIPKSILAPEKRQKIGLQIT
ncbi:hypothetical protein RFI_39879, partial [Reticulomyxa filosa]